MGFDRAQLKQSVRQAMRMTRPRPMLVTLLFGVMVSVSTGIINGILGRVLTGGAGDLSSMLTGYMMMGYELEDAWERAALEMLGRGPGFIFGMVVGGFVLSVIVALWQSLLNVGYEGYALSMVRREGPPLERVFCAFPMFPQVLITRVLTGAFLFLWAVLVCVGWSVLAIGVVMLGAAIGSDILMSVLMLALIAALWAGIAWVTLRYALVDYVLLDKGLSGMDAIRESKRLMKGNISKAFLLRLSFFGWYALLILMIYAGIFLALLPILMQVGIGVDAGGLVVSALMALGIGALTIVGFVALSVWLRPYATGCMAAFYDWAKAQADGIPSSPSFGGPGFGGGGGWSQPADYTWSSGPASGTGTGNGPSRGSGNGNGGGDGNGSGGSAPRPPKPPRDDPWN